MSASKFDWLWLAAVLAFIAYPVGDILGFWEIEAPVVLLASVTLLIAGRNVGKARGARRG